MESSDCRFPCRRVLVGCGPVVLRRRTRRGEGAAREKHESQGGDGENGWAAPGLGRRDREHGHFEAVQGLMVCGAYRLTHIPP